MLPAAHRIRTAAEFRETTRHGVRTTRGCVVVYLATSDEAAPARLGVIASSSIGGSVVRHRATRRIRGVLTARIAQLPSGSRIVVRALPGADVDPLLPQHVLAALDSVVAKSSDLREPPSALSTTATGSTS